MFSFPALSYSVYCSVFIVFFNDCYLLLQCIFYNSLYRIPPLCWKTVYFNVTYCKPKNMQDFVQKDSSDILINNDICIHSSFVFA